MRMIFRPIYTFRENLRQIGTAVSAAREYSEAGKQRADSSASSAIPL